MLARIRPSTFPSSARLQIPRARYLSVPPTTPASTNQSWLTRKVKQSPTALKVFLAAARALGYGNARQVAGRRAWVLYEQICVGRADDEAAFWRDECHLPPTFQSWFTITNLHVWLLTVRLRALPKPHGPAHIQSLIDHFFLDVEDRIRAVLQPGPTPSAQRPYTPASRFYAIPNAAQRPPSPHEDRAPQTPRGRAPDRLVSRQMKIFREQWAGMGMSLDYSLLKGDTEMAAAVWRNLLGGRGARGIAFAAGPAPATQRRFRRSVNLVGGKVEDVAALDARGIDAEEARDDGSGVHDFAPAEADRYVRYPETMAALVAYVRRELRRLERLEDAAVMGGPAEAMRFGAVRALK